jgi:hypothetical protein
MWAYESVFYQIYPLGFVGAPFENDGVETHRILKVLDWTDHIKKLGANAIYFSPMGTIQGTIVKSIAASVRMKTLSRFAISCTAKASGLCWMACSIMQDAASGHFRMF